MRRGWVSFSPCFHTPSPISMTRTADSAGYMDGARKGQESSYWTSPVVRCAHFVGLGASESWLLPLGFSVGSSEMLTGTLTCIFPDTYVAFSSSWPLFPQLSTQAHFDQAPVTLSRNPLGGIEIDQGSLSPQHTFWSNRCVTGVYRVLSWQSLGEQCPVDTSPLLVLIGHLIF